MFQNRLLTCSVPRPSHPPACYRSTKSRDRMKAWGTQLYFYRVISDLFSLLTVIDWVVSLLFIPVFKELASLAVS